MEEFGTNVPRDDIYSKAVRAGKRTYFFDVKATRANELYLTITESKRRFNQQTGNFFYEKHKLFLYREDFDKFKEALEETFEKIGEMQGEIIPREQLQEQAGAVDNTADQPKQESESKADDDKKEEEDKEDASDV